MKKTLGAVTASVFVITLLAGCGGGSSSSSLGTYCGDIRSASTELKGLGSSSEFTTAKFTAATSAVHKVAAEAPNQDKGSWATIESQFSFLNNALTAAGLTIDDFSKLTQGQTPAGLDPTKLADLKQKLQSFDTSALSAATNSIKTEVKNDCKIDLPWK